MSRSRKFSLLLVLGVVIISFFLGEIGLRFFYFWRGEYERRIYIPHRYCGFVHSKNNRFVYRYTEQNRIVVPHQTNSFGLLGEEVALRKSKDTIRILVLGDSFTEALQVPANENYCQRLEEFLNKRGAPVRYEVLNGGVSGFSPITMYQLFKKELSKLKPDLVIVQLFANDVFEDNKLRAMSLLDMEGLPVKIRPYFSPQPSRLARSNAFWEDWRDWTIEHSRWMEALYVSFFKMQKNSSFHRQMTKKAEYSDGYQFFIINPGSELFYDEAFREATWNNTQKYLLALKKEVEDSSARFMMLYIPMELQLSLDSYGEHASLYSGKLNDHLNKRLADFSRAQQIPFLDLLSLFEEHKTEGLYLSRDGHLTPRGHHVVADALLKSL